MMLLNAELDILALESDKLILNPEYRSEVLYSVLHSFIYHIYNLKRYRGYPSYVLETAELNAIIKCYKAIPKYNKTTADKARIDKGYKTDHKRGLYRFLEVVITNSLLTTFSKINKRQNNERKMVSLDDYNEDGDAVLELADIKYNGIAEIENEIDRKAAAIRASEFEEILNRIQKELDNE